MGCGVAHVPQYLGSKVSVSFDMEQLNVVQKEKWRGTETCRKVARAQTEYIWLIKMKCSKCIFSRVFEQRQVPIIHMHCVLCDVVSALCLVLACCCFVLRVDSRPTLLSGVPERAVQERKRGLYASAT